MLCQKPRLFNKKLEYLCETRQHKSFKDITIKIKKDRVTSTTLPQITILVERQTALV